MAGRHALSTALLIVVLVTALAGLAGAQSAGDAPALGDRQDLTHGDADQTPSELPAQSAVPMDADEDGTGGNGDGEGGEEDAEDREEEEDEGASLVGDWWGLGGEATETAYVGLVEAGVLLLVLGLGGYSIGKRSSFVPPQYRRYLLPAHQWTMLIGTALTAPHFFGVEEWEGLGFAVGVLLAIEVVSGLYGRYLHRHVIRMGRGEETAPGVGYLLSLSKQTVFSRWRRIHVLLTLVTGVVLVMHIVTAVAD
jgi:hypothetical protein